MKSAAGLLKWMCADCGTEARVRAEDREVTPCRACDCVGKWYPVSKTAKKLYEKTSPTYTSDDLRPDIGAPMPPQPGPERGLTFIITPIGKAKRRNNT